MFYRIKQFFWALTARVKTEDMKFINTYLDNRELELFLRLPIYDQVHSIKVAREVFILSNNQNLYDIMLMKAALLHDIGKVDGGLNLINKSIIILLDKFAPIILKNIEGMKAIYTYYNHPKIGEEYLNFENDYVRYLVKNHHNYDLKGDEKLKILQESDCKN